MRILLINPPLENSLPTEVPTLVNEERGYNPPLGLMYIASYANEYSDHEIMIMDSQVEGLSLNKIKERIREYDPDVVGMTAMSFTLIDCLKVADASKDINKNVKIVLGGPHPNLYPNETINLKNIDFLVLGEGEINFLDLMNNIKNPKKVRGIVYKEGNRTVITGPPKFIDDLDKIPFPDRTMTPFKKYTSLLAKDKYMTTMITSRGCPYKCLFCDRPHLGKKFRARSAKNVVQEMKECLNLGIKEFLIYDDTFTIDRQRVVDICNLIIKGGLKVRWDIRARVNTVDFPLLKLLKKAGCDRIHYGVEAGNDEILRILRKGVTKKQVRETFKLTKKANIQTLAYFMIGSPRETKKTIIESIEFAKELDPDYVHFTITTPFPGTDLYFLGLKEGIIKGDVWKEFAKNPKRDFVPPLWEENLDRKELTTLLRRAYKDFYIRPKYILKRLTKLRSIDELKKTAKAGIKVLGL